MFCKKEAFCNEALLKVVFGLLLVGLKDKVFSWGYFRLSFEVHRETSLMQNRFAALQLQKLTFLTFLDDLLDVGKFLFSFPFKIFKGVYLGDSKRSYPIDSNDIFIILYSKFRDLSWIFSKAQNEFSSSKVRVNFSSILFVSSINLRWASTQSESSRKAKEFFFGR